MLSITDGGPRIWWALLEFSRGGACFSCSAELDVQDHLSTADLGQNLMASKATVDYLYQQLIVYCLDRDFVLQMQHISRIAMLPPDSH